MASGESPAEEGVVGSTSSDTVRMHRCLLYLRPRYAEREYFRQLEAFDLVNCLIAPIFFANTLSMWTRSVLSGIYCAVLLIKGYQMALLLLPNARRVQAHKHARYWLILGERVLRQCFATPMLGRGPRFLAWLKEQASHASKIMFSMRLLLLMSGLTISFWNAFCLQLDFVSNVCITLIFFCIHFQANCTQIAYVFQLILERVPHLLLLQQGTEHVLATAAELLRAVVLMQPAAASTTTPSTAGFAAVHGSCSGESQGMASAAAEASNACLSSSQAPFAVGSMLFERPKPAPDFDSVAGRFILMCSITYMVFAVLFLPIYLSWRVERSWKSRWMSSLTEAQQQLLQQQDTGEQRSSLSSGNAAGVEGGSSDRTATCAAASGSSRAERSGGVGGKRQQPLLWGSWLLPLQWRYTLSSITGSKSSSFVYPPVVFDIAPAADILAKHVLMMLGAALVVSGVAIASCMWHPPLSGVLFTWPQIL